MNKNSIFFGIGIGILLSCAIFFIVYSIQRHIFLSQINSLELDLYNNTVNIQLDSNSIFPNLNTYDIIGNDNQNYEIENTLEILDNMDSNDDDSIQEVSYNFDIEPEGVLVSIPIGLDATSIAILLEEYGIIESSFDFIQFLIQNNYNYIIMAGEFYLYKNHSFEYLASQIMAQ